MLKEPIGKQDQYAASYGGLNIIHFQCSGKVVVEPLYIKNEVYDALQENLLMFYIGNERKASDILTEQKKNISSEDKFNTLKNMVSLVFEMKNCLYNENLDDFGRILHENWILKQSLASNISNKSINDIYNIGLKNGATGGKLLGAGGGGFIIFYIDKMYHKKLTDALAPLNNLSFKFENEGSKLIYFGDEQF